MRAAVIIVSVPSIKTPVFFDQHRLEGDRHRIQNNHPFILECDIGRVSPTNVPLFGGLLF
jgi:hypothetical protein